MDEERASPHLERFLAEAELAVPQAAQFLLELFAQAARPAEPDFGPACAGLCRGDIGRTQCLSLQGAMDMEADSGQCGAACLEAGHCSVGSA